MSTNFSAIGMLFAIIIFSGISRVEACTPGNYEYDELASADSLITVAKIAKHEFNIHDDKVCFRTHYKIDRIIFGSHSKDIVVDYCLSSNKDTPYLQSEKKEMIDAMPEYEKFFGYYAGAEVILFLTKADPIRGESKSNFLSEYRPQRHSCWEIHQIDMAPLTEAQRSEYLESLRIEIEEAVEGK